MARRSRTTPHQIETVERQARALELRKAGVSLRQIAEELGYASPSGACEAIKAALEQTRAEPADDLRELMIARLDELLVTAWEGALAGDMDAVNTVLKIEERRARLLGIELKDPKLNIKLPALKEPKDATAIVAALLERVASGELPADVAGKLSTLVQGFMKLTETVELADRVAKLEEAQDNGFERPHGRGIA